MIVILIRYGFLFAITVFVLILLSFIIAHVFPGELLTNLSGVIATSVADNTALEEKWAMDSPTIWQFFNYCKLMIQGEWGVSLVSGNALLNEMKRTLPATIELSFYSAFIAIFLGIPLGCIAGVKAYTKVDFSINGLSIIQNSLPVFWLGLAFILIFCFSLNIFPLSGRLSVLFDVPQITGFIFVDILLTDDINKAAAFTNAIVHMILPSIAVGIVSAANLTRLVRRSVIDVLNKPYIRAAKSRGLAFKTILFNHVLRNALLPVLPLAGIQITTLVTNAMIIESLFSWPGVGSFLLDAIYQQDYSAIRVGMLVVSVVVISLTIFVDLINRIIDPRKSSQRDVSI